MKITLKALNVFYCIVKYKTVQAAADALNMTQSAASQALLKLENALNTQLFDRNGRQLILNENGGLLLPLALNMLESAQRIEHVFLLNPIVIKIGASTTIANYVMPEQLAKFYAQHPSAKLDMMVGNSAAVIAAILNFNIDIGIVEGECCHPDIVVRPWQEDELVIFGHYDSKSFNLTKTQLAKTPWILREKGSGTRAVVELFLKSYIGEFNLRMELGNSEAIKYSVAAGLGISCLSRYVVEDLILQNKITLIETSLPKLKRTFYIITHRNKSNTKGIELFLKFMMATRE
ncbi:LysR family transcriptional regulator [Orbus hercynius]|nr:LysR family transcriptional regulator [Orbus hercynius]